MKELRTCVSLQSKHVCEQYEFILTQKWNIWECYETFRLHSMINFSCFVCKVHSLPSPFHIQIHSSYTLLYILHLNANLKHNFRH